MSIFWTGMRMMMGWYRVHSTYIVVLIKGVGSVRAGRTC